MKRLLSTTTALSLALTTVQPWPLLAQTLAEDGSVLGPDGSVLCVPTAEAPCNPDDFVAAANAIAEAMAAEQAAAEQAAAEAAAAEQAAAEAAAAEQAAAEAAAAEQAAAEAAAAEQAAAEAAAAEQAAAEAAAAEQAAAEAAAAEQAAAEAAAAEQAAAEAAAAEQAAAEAAAAEQAATEEATAEPVEEPATEEATAEPVEEPATEETAAEPVEEPATEKATAEPVEEPATEEATAEPVAEPATEEATAEPVAEPVNEEATAEPVEEPATEEATAEPVEEPAIEGATAEPVEEPATEEATAEPVEEPATEEATAEPAVLPEPTPEELAAQEAARAAAEAEIVVESDGTVVDPAAGLKTEAVVVDPDAEPVDAPVVEEAQVETLTEILAQPEAVDPAALEAAATLAAEPGEAERQPVAEAPVSEAAIDSVVQVLTAADTRSSDREFAPPPVEVAPGKKDRLSDLEKVGLVALGALVVGAIINEGNKREERQVVSNTGDRVIVLKPDGTYQVYKDDDAVLRRPGSTVRTETFRDGSTRTIVEREDGTQVVTIRDASGRVLRRAQYDRLGREIVLIDDLEPEEVVIVEKLPKPKKKAVVISSKDENAALKAKLAAREAEKAGRKFSLRQVREIPEVRALAAMIDVDSVTFDSGSAAIKATEADALADLGGLMQDLLDANPAEVFLIEGHTDATGKAAMNLALSDRRAESVALALTEYFDIPPENMVVQGYGESELLIDTQEDERQNRRVVVRVITPLLKTGG